MHYYCEKVGDSKPEAGELSPFEILMWKLYLENSQIQGSCL